MLVWVASYPRSGNHLLRMILKQCFDLDSYTIYQNNERGAESWRYSEDNRTLNARTYRNVVGAARFDDASETGFLERARASPEMILVKTHDRVPADDRAIYVVRDARAVLLSLARMLNQRGRPTDIPAVIRGGRWPGPWSDHVEHFLARDTRSTLLLRYEDLSSKAPPLDAIADFLGVPTRRPFDVEFAKMRAVDPHLFVVGHNRAGIDLIEQDHAQLFWKYCGQTMQRLGYPRFVARPQQPAVPPRAG